MGIVVVVVVVDSLYITIKAVIYAHNLAPVSVSWKPVFHEFYCKRGHIRRLVCTPFVSATKVSSMCTHTYQGIFLGETEIVGFEKTFKNMKL